jgi:aminomethyltransferase
MSESLKRTPLYDSHKKHGARFVSFGGWEMPVQYAGVIEEHNTVRTKVGLFDVSHMGEITVKGPEALTCLNYLLSNDVSKLTPGKAHYTVLLTEEGTPVDDLIVYQMGVNDYFLCVNASNCEKDFEWLVAHNTFDAKITNESANYAQIAVQGPKSQALCEKFLGRSLANLQTFSHEPLNTSIGGVKLEGFIARTGYTGENGYEIYLKSDQGTLVWDSLLEFHSEFGVTPIGLGARDSLRLEAALCLYGHELKPDIDILSAGLGWVTKFSKPDFMGKDALLVIKAQGTPLKLVGLELVEPGIAREDTVVRDANGDEIGFVTSGTKTPTVGKSIALAYMRTSALETSDNGLFCVVRGKPIKAKLVPIPFYKKA